MRAGPIPLHDAMATAAEAYYARGSVFGRDGDFITAPEISQIFGELIGLWCAVVWQRMGMPSSFRLVECGPGRGTLMADLLRAGARVSGFTEAADIHLVERSATLRARQRETLASRHVTWHDGVDAVPPGPAIFVANEFADALPIRQFVRLEVGWAECCVGLENHAFAFVDMPVPDAPVPETLKNAPVDSVFEVCPGARRWISHVAARIVQEGGAALIIDYGHTASALGDTLQAVKHHKYHPVLEDLGNADLTAHVDFQALGDAARGAGAAVLGPVPQGTWLAQLGLKLRLAQLTQGMSVAHAAAISDAARRLATPDGMGLLFKVMAVVCSDLVNPALATLDGFAQDAAP